jgi:hypothetical protein
MYIHIQIKKKDYKSVDFFRYNLEYRDKGRTGFFSSCKVADLISSYFGGLRGVDTYVGDVVPPDEDIAVASHEASIVVLPCSFEHQVHISVRLGHPPPVLTPVLQGDHHIVPNSLDEDVKRLLSGLQIVHLVSGSNM